MLYHGSCYKIDAALRPHLSFDYTPYLYATSDYNYALLRCGQFIFDEIIIREEYDGQLCSICELCPGAIKSLFDRPGWIYVFDDTSSFKKSAVINEYISDKPVQYQHRIYIPNILQEILAKPDVFKIVYFTNDQEEYWMNVSGGKDGYLQRRKQRIQKIQEVREKIYE